MPSGEEILGLLDLTPLTDDVMRGEQDRDSMLAKTYGGLLFGQAMVAAARTAPVERSVHSFQALCLDAGRHDAPVDYHVENLRDGGSFSARSVTAVQGGRTLLRALASFHVDEPGLVHVTPAPEVPEPESMPTLADAMSRHRTMDDAPWRTEWTGLDIRYDTSFVDHARAPEPGRQRVWMRMRDRLPDDPALHAHLLVYLSDLTLLSAALLPHGLMLGDPELPRATLNHDVWLHRPARVDEWLLVEQVSPWAAGSRGLARAEVFTPDGTHVATYAQEGLIRARSGLRAGLAADLGWS